jgi:hypothetical protein
LPLKAWIWCLQEVAQLGQQALAAELALQHVNQELQQLKADNQQLAGRLEVGAVQVSPAIEHDAAFMSWVSVHAWGRVRGAGQHMITVDVLLFLS